MVSPNTIAFPYHYEIVPRLGRIFIPKIPIILKTTYGFEKHDFFVDTGSVLTTIPLVLAERLNIDFTKAEKGTAVGIGGFEMDTWYTTIDLYFTKDSPITVQASITNEDKTPPLLGQYGLLDKRQSWHFDSREKRIVFEGV